jgi:dCTP deaminase
LANPETKPFGQPSAMAAQSERLLRRLGRIRTPEYPVEAARIAFLIASVVTYIRGELLVAAASRDATSAQNSRRQRLLRETIHELYSYVRYLEASRSATNPPEIQAAISAITEYYFGDRLNRCVVVARPQWNYNLSYVPLTWKLRGHVNLEVLDPPNALGLRASADSQPEVVADGFLDYAWSVAYSQIEDRDWAEILGSRPPVHIAVVSFAGLDTDDAFQLPLLAHELGHFVDLINDPPFHMTPEVVQTTYMPPGVIEDRFPDLTAEETEVLWTEANGRLSICLQETVADLIATRMLGPAFFLPHSDFLSRTAVWPQTRVINNGYPGIAWRIKNVVDELRRIDTLRGLEDSSEGGEWLRSHISEWGNRLESAGPIRVTAFGPKDYESFLNEVVADAVQRSLPQLRELATKLVPDDKCARLTSTLDIRLRALDSDLPAYLDGDAVQTLPEIYTAAWIHHLRNRDKEGLVSEDAEALFAMVDKSSRLVAKTLELAITMPQSGLSRRLTEFSTQSSQIRQHGGVLGEEDIRTRLTLPVTDSRSLAFVPQVDNALQSASIDVHLGNWFRVARRIRLPLIDLRQILLKSYPHNETHELVYVPFDSPFTLHPGDFVLGISLEFIALPNDVMAFVEGKSRPGRTGLIVATATQVAPGFKGCVVLELANTGAVPLQVAPGTPIAQLVLVSLITPARPYAGSSQCQTRP